MSNIPEDPMILLSFINTNLRDYYTSLAELCDSMSLDMDKINSKLNTIDYFYDEKLNKFV
ncbi:MAG: DUF4250 domain-containing protein [Lachnospiraceae bacterium]|nr:DUF4250 domain-containing protein [Lachnospiraceae bacterium]